MKLINIGPKVVQHLQIKRRFLEVMKDELREKEGKRVPHFTAHHSKGIMCWLAKDTMVESVKRGSKSKCSYCLRIRS